jgi:hypothetical protein
MHAAVAETGADSVGSSRIVNYCSSTRLLPIPVASCRVAGQRSGPYNVGPEKIVVHLLPFRSYSPMSIWLENVRKGLKTGDRGIQTREDSLVKNATSQGS